MGARRGRVDIVTQDEGILTPEATGLVESVQAARVIVTVDGEATSHVVVRNAVRPFLFDSDDESVRKVFPDAVVSLIQADVAGHTTISCFGVGARERFGAAAAVATMKRCWGWDESPTITVTFEADGRAFRLDPVVADGVWWVDVPDPIG
jgi:hypothetical protein